MDCLFLHLELSWGLVKLICGRATCHNDVLSFELPPILKCDSACSMVDVFHRLSELKLCTKFSGFISAAVEGVLNSNNSCVGGENTLDVIGNSKSGPSLVYLGGR